MTPAELEIIAKRLEDDLRGGIRRRIVTLTAESLASPPVMLLASLGVDVNEKLLQIFIQEATNLLSKEGTDA